MCFIFSFFQLAWKKEKQLERKNKKKHTKPAYNCYIKIETADENKRRKAFALRFSAVGVSVFFGAFNRQKRKKQNHAQNVVLMSNDSPAKWVKFDVSLRCQKSVAF